MWHGTLKGSDIQQANEKLKEQRSAIQAHLKHLESRIGELETFERSVVNFVSSYEVEYGSSATLGDPEPVAEKVAGEIASEQSSSTSSQTATVGDPEPAAEKVADDEKRDGWTSLTLLSGHENVFYPTQEISARYGRQLNGPCMLSYNPVKRPILRSPAS